MGDVKKWSAGVGILFKSSPYIGNEPRILPLPLISYRGERLTVTGPRAEYLLGRTGPLNYSLRLAVDFEGYEEDDDPRLEGLGDRDITLVAGGKVGLSLPWKLKAEAGLAREITGEHDGWTTRFNLERSWRKGSWILTPGIYLVHHDDRYTEYYFGVPAGLAREDRPVYNPDDAYRYGGGLTAIRRIGENWILTLRGDVLRLSDELTDSPLVEDDLEAGLIAGLTRRF